MFKELVHCILFNLLKSKQFHEVGRAISILHVKKLRPINLTQCVPSHTAKYVVGLSLDHEPSESTDRILFTRPLENLLGEDHRLGPVKA